MTVCGAGAGGGRSRGPSNAPGGLPGGRLALGELATRDGPGKWKAIQGPHPEKIGFSFYV